MYDASCNLRKRKRKAEAYIVNLCIGNGTIFLPALVMFPGFELMILGERRFGQVSW